MSPNRPGRSRRRRFTLGSGPLKRTSDRVEFASRVLLLLALLSAVPVGLAVGAAAWTAVHATADAQAATRSEVTATLLFDAPEPEPGSDTARTTAVWTAPEGGTRSARIDAPAGARAGEEVGIWVDRSGDLTPAPLDEAQVAGQAVVIGVLAGLGLLLAALTGHLLVTWALDRRRDRQWATGWLAVEPLWVSRFR